MLFASLSGCAAITFFPANAPAAFSDLDRRVNLAYGTDPRQKLDVYTPHMALNRPVVIFWYGGSWQKGNKSNYRFVGTTLASSGSSQYCPTIGCIRKLLSRYLTKMVRTPLPG